ncbi:cyclase family protein [bacterium]|nr:cyclase family protein [bacterium]
MKKIIDISREISAETKVFQGDRNFSCKWTSEIKNGSVCNVSEFHTTSHVATHADAPFHTEQDGKKITEIPLSCFCGTAKVIQTEKPEISLTASLEKKLQNVKRVLFKTLTSPETASSLSSELAEFLVKNGVILVGTDSMSVDKTESTDLKIHRRLLQNGIVILEGLDLSQVQEGVYELIAFPLKLKNFEASPVRAVLRQL